MELDMISTFRGQCYHSPTNANCAQPLKGNTRSRHLDLLEPVQLNLGKDKTVIKAGLTRWDYGRQRLTSTVPFQAVSPTAEATGDGFVVDRNHNLDHFAGVPAEAACEALTAWVQLELGSERLIADGDVVLT